MQIDNYNPQLPDLKNKSPNLINEFIHSALYSGVQEPVTSVKQIINNIHNQLSQDKWQNNFNFMARPSNVKFGSLDWLAQTLGSGVGMVAPFMVAQTGSLSSLDRLGLINETEITNSALALSVKDSAIAGASYGILFSPVNNSEPAFWQAKLKNALGNALTFSTISAGSIGVSHLAETQLAKSLGLNILLSNKIINGSLGGLPGGLINTEYNSIITQHKLASITNIKESEAGMALIGGIFGAKSLTTSLDSNFDHIQPNQLTERNLALTPINHSEITVKPTYSPNESIIILPEPQTLNIPIYDEAGKVIQNITLAIPQKPVIPELKEYPLFDKNESLTETESPTTKNNIVITKHNETTLVEHPDGTKQAINYLGVKTIYANGLETYRQSYPNDFLKLRIKDGELYLKDDGDIIVKKGNHTSLTFKTDGTISGHTDVLTKIKISPQANNRNIIEASFTDGTNLVKIGDNIQILTTADGVTHSHIGKIHSILGNTGQETIIDSSGNQQIIDRNPEYQKLIDTINQKFNDDHFGYKEYTALLEKFNPEDRKIASNFIKISAHNLSTYNLMKAYREINQEDPNMPGNLFEYYTQNSSSVGNLLAYFFRKAVNRGGDINPVSNISKEYDQNFLPIFDNLAKFPHADLQKLANSPKKIILIDTNNFEDGLNFIDIAQGKAFEKIDILVKKFKDYKTANPEFANMTDEEIAKSVLIDPLYEKAISINADHILSPQPISIETALTPAVTPNRIKDFLDTSYPVFSQKLEAAKILALDAQNHTIGSILHNATELKTILAYNLATSTASAASPNAEAILAKGNEALSNAKYVVGLDGNFGASSSAIISYLYKLANAIPDSQFISRQDFINTPNDSKNPFILLDDAIYSGTQIKGLWQRQQNISPHDLHIGVSGMYEGFAQSDFIRRNGQFVSSLTTYIPYSALRENQILLKLTDLIKSDQNTTLIHKDLIDRLVNRRFITSNSIAFRNTNSFNIWPYMTPDNSLNLIREFGNKLLGLP